MSNLVNPQGQRIDTLITPEQNLALHQQSRQLIQGLGQEFGLISYRQALLIEYTFNRLETLGFDMDMNGFEAWAIARDKEINKEKEQAQLEADAKATAEAQATVAELFAKGTAVQLED
jgi:hypothetical protein